MSAVVRVEACRHRYGRVEALAGISLALPAGRLIGFVGPDGVGKSTLLGLIAGVREVQAGRIEVFGEDIADPKAHRRLCYRIAYMPQGLGHNLYATLSVWENAEFFGRLFGFGADERRRRIERLLAAVGLAPFRDRPAGKLSGGMKQKLGLCCALLHEPDLLILDEPTTGVDPLSRRQFWELIDMLREERSGMSVLVATAYMEEAARFDRLVAMDAGRILATGTAAELLDRTGAADMESAYVALLPPDKRRGHAALSIPPRRNGRGEAAIEASGLTRRFGDFLAVDGVSFRIERGEIFGFLGSNGCGKTTTMKMLTGLLPASAGSASLFGQPVASGNSAMRRRIGFMSQGFSLYTELTVRQNLELHAHIFGLPPSTIEARIGALVSRMDLTAHLDALAESLPLGIRQRLSLAVALVHEPELLILDEPTSGVDPVARDRFWEILAELSRDKGVTIFISTHFMNEAARCDRISLMHAGRVLAQGAPADLVREAGVASLEDAFIACLERESASTVVEAGAASFAPAADASVPAASPWFSARRFKAYVWRETMELVRDPIRLAFALIGPMLLMVVMGYGISLDVEHLPYAALDYDRTPESRRYLEHFAHSRYFEERAPLSDDEDLLRQMARGQLNFAVEIPPGFGRDLKAGRRAEVGIRIDGSIPFRANTVQGYVEAVHARFRSDLIDESGTRGLTAPLRVETRFRYNPDMKSVYALVPGVIAVMLAVIPPILTAVSVVREKEMGSITNLYATPSTRLEFLLGKQLPYVVVGLVNALSLIALALWLFGVPVKGDLWALLLGAVLAVAGTTGWGLLISAFTRSQIAALFAAFLLSIVPAINFSGFLAPAASQTGAAAVMGYGFPTSWFLTISVGVFTKALGFPELYLNHAALLAFVLGYLGLSLMLLPTRGR
ncbi:ribosome-associated ATPase/putative transporter RbbA [Methylococcus geothermalis]|uniref:Ribosome-associated ATPase/putative transporter RbbA n=1 Tax=Methylococcus geothermalis TaxID=2681310 RepID=A0A858Q9V4_9GAMM|nr:ribosome-associated ATPase/putative transporter RbbA [Methylococcus geothermalis]QJD30561.1 ribosome-associated ATPase/putative transporter RbbA [Methylococcus geothermalis]